MSNGGFVSAWKASARWRTIALDVTLHLHGMAIIYAAQQRQTVKVLHYS
jgi:hypothetical protein